MWPPLMLAGSILLFYTSKQNAKKRYLSVHWQNYCTASAFFNYGESLPARPQFTNHLLFKSSFIFLFASHQQNSTSFDEDACCDRRKPNTIDEECGCPNNKLFREHKIYSGYRDARLKLPVGYCPG